MTFGQFIVRPRPAPEISEPESAAARGPEHPNGEPVRGAAFAGGHVGGDSPINGANFAPCPEQGETTVIPSTPSTTKSSVGVLVNRQVVSA